MIIELNLDSYKHVIESKGFMMIDARLNKIPKIVIEDFSDFLSLAEIYSIKVILTDLYFYDDSDFDLLTIYDIDEKYRVEDINKKINEFNQRLQSFRYLNGKEQFIDLYFNYQGIIYNYSWGNDALDETNSDYFLECLDEQFAKEIEKNEEKRRNEHINRMKEYINKLKEYIKNDKSFLICTNQDLRRSYTQRILEEDDLKPPDEVSFYSVFSVVNETWTEMKNFRRLT